MAPAELEAVLLSHPAIADAGVIPSPDEEAGEVPKAFVVLKGEISEEEIMEFVAARVAPHKRIRKVEFVSEIPKSPAGKILRRVLVQRERARPGPVLNPSSSQSNLMLDPDRNRWRFVSTAESPSNYRVRFALPASG